MDEILSTFLVECSENVAQLDQDLVVLEKHPHDKDLLNRIFRAMHTIKGSCGLFELQRMERVAHVAEDVLGKLREGELAVGPGLIGPILSALDIIKDILKSLEAGGKEPPGDDSAVVTQLRALLEMGPGDVQTPEGQPSCAKTTGDLREQSLRVGIDILDSLMNMVGELVLVRNQLNQLVQTEEESRFIHPIQHLDRVTTGLQESVMKTRMQPIGNAWGSLTRVVRDLAQSSGKRIEIVMTGQETEIDRQVLQAIKDPLVHCVRNSADHGIEDVATRKKNGKSEGGRIALDAFHEGGHIVINIKDDGAGVDLDAVRRKAVARGLIKPDVCAELSEQETLQLLFEPGFSTAAKITEVSGRGVGMDVVKTNVERIGGQVNIFTSPGTGTTVQMKIPLTLAIVSALIVGVDGEPYAVPQVGVLELVRVSDSNVHLIEDINGSKLFRLRDRLLPLIHLSSVVSMPAGQGPGSFEFSQARNLVIVVTQVGETVFGLCVDEIFDTQEIVVKPVGRLIRDVNLFSGATILGDGRLVLILDTARIAARALSSPVQRSRSDADAPKDGARDATTTLLLFRSERQTPMAVPLALVARLEEFSRDKVEFVDGKHFIQYRDSLLPLVLCDQGEGLDSRELRAVIFSDGRRSMGLVVAEISDIVEQELVVQSSGSKPGVLGVAIINGKATEVLDIHFYLQAAHSDWFADDRDGQPARATKVLIVDDSHFFREMLRPLLSARGYQVCCAKDGAEAWSRLQTGEGFDLVVSDIDMPHMDGFALVEQIRSRSDLTHLPVLALTARRTPLDQRRAETAGFNAFLEKFDPTTFLTAVESSVKRGSSRK